MWTRNCLRETFILPRVCAFMYQWIVQRDGIFSDFLIFYCLSAYFLNGFFICVFRRWDVCYITFCDANNMGVTKRLT